MLHVAMAVAARIFLPAVIAVGGCASEPAQPFDSKVTVAFLDRIDDLDDGDDAILALGFRIGFWYAFNDGTTGAVQTPSGLLFSTTPGGPSGAGFCARSFGHGFEGWGAGMGLDLNDAGDPITGISKRAPYDSSPFKGVAFDAKGIGQMRFAVSTAAVELVSAGGTCVGGTQSPACADNHGVNIPLTSGWRTYAVPFNRLTQEGFGLRVPFDVTKTVALYFSVAEGEPFDFSIDNVGFFR